MKIFLRVLGMLCLSTTLLMAQQNDRLAKVVVSYSGSISGNNYQLFASDEDHAMIMVSDEPGYAPSTPSGQLTLVPGKIYGVTLGSSTGDIPPAASASFQLTFTAPPGFSLFVAADANLLPTQRAWTLAGSQSYIGANNSFSYQFKLVDDAAFTPAQAGRLTRLGVADLVLEFGMGTLANGKSAGRLQLRHAGKKSSGYGFADATSYDSPFSLANLHYDGPPGTGLGWPSSGPQRIDTGQVRVERAAITNGYTLTFYAASTTSGYESTPFLSYTVEKSTDSPPNAPASSDCMKVTETHGSGTGQIVLVHYIFRSTMSDTWTLIEGTGTQQRVEEHASAVVSGNREETITIKDSTGALKAKRKVTWSAGAGTELATKIEEWTDLASSTPGLVTSQTYTGARVHTVTLPNNTTKTYDYYTDEDRQGLVSKVTEEWSTDTTPLTKETTYDYDGPAGALHDYLAATATKIGGTTVSKTTSDYTFTTTSPEGKYLAVRTTMSYAASGASLTSSAAFYQRDEDYVYSQRPYYIKTPEGRQQSFAYQRGTYSDGTFTPSESGPMWRTLIVNGATSGGTTLSSILGSVIEPIHVAAGKATLTVIIRDANESIVSQKTYPLDPTLWLFDLSTPIASITNVWFDAVRQASAVSSKGTEASWTWNGLFLESSTDEMGIETDYTYDSVGRLETKVVAGVGATDDMPAQADKTFTYGYDAANRQVSMIESSGALSRTTSYDYDGVGRLTKTTLPDGRYSTKLYEILGSGKTRVTESPLNSSTVAADRAAVVTQNFPDGKMESITGDIEPARYASYSVGADGKITVTTHYGASNSARYTTETADWLGRPVESRMPQVGGGSETVEARTYDPTTGTLASLSRSGWAETLFSYNELGELTRSGVSLDGSVGLQTASASDRVADSDTVLVKEGSPAAWWTQTASKVYATASSGTAALMQTDSTRLTGIGSSGLAAESRTADRNGNTVVSKTYVYPAAKEVKTEVSVPGAATPQQNFVLNGRPGKTVSPDGRTVTNTYDGLGRLSKVTDSRTGDTVYEYIGNTDFVQKVKDPRGLYVAIYGYDSAGRVNQATDAKGAVTYTKYDKNGRVQRRWGSGTQPVEYAYDPYGQVVAMRTFRSTEQGAELDFTGSTWPLSDMGTDPDHSDPASWTHGDITTWSYDAATGVLLEKKDAKQKAVTYTYYAEGLLHTRQWARKDALGNRITTTYEYVDLGTTRFVGDLKKVSYSDGTPAVEYQDYDRLGRPTHIDDATGGRDFVYDSANPERLQTEKLDASFYGLRWLSQQYETGESGTVNGRYAGYQLGIDGNLGRDVRATYGYDSLTRLNSAVFAHGGITSASRSFGYTYGSDCSLLETTIDTTGNDYRVSPAYDPHADVLSAWTTRFGAANSTPVVGCDYTYDKAWRRDSAKLSGTAFEGELGGQTYYRYTYDGRGNLLQGFAYMGETVPDDPSDDNETKQLSGRQFAYTYDSIGNRRSATNHGDGQPANVYTSNAVNQLDTRENHSVPVQGSAAPDATVAVTSTTNTGVVNIAAARQGRYWGAEAVLANGGAENGGNGSAVCAQITIVAAKAGGGTNPDKVKTVPGLALLGPALEQMTYDEDGNLTNDGLRNYYYDAENRLLSVEANDTVRGFTTYTAKRVEFAYDYVGRRAMKRVVTWDRATAQWLDPVELRFVYQGWNLLAEISTASGTLVRSYAWGLDAAASLNATGGVGALLEVVDHAANKTYLPAYDGNGNVLALLNATTGAVTNRYEYSPFGELLRDEKVATDAPANPFRWSTKYTDDETDLVYYGMRYYAPSQGRFFGRDPSGENGGLNLYGLCGNDPVNGVDLLGMYDWNDFADWSDYKDYLAGITDAHTAKVNERMVEEMAAGQAMAAAMVGYDAAVLQKAIDRGEVQVYGTNANGDTVLGAITLAGQIAILNAGESYSAATGRPGLLAMADTSRMDVAGFTALTGLSVGIGGAVDRVLQSTGLAVSGFEVGSAQKSVGTGNALIDAKLSKGIYDESFTGTDGYNMVGKPFTAQNGLRAAVFSNGTDNVLVYAGTSPSSLANWWANLTQAFGFKSAQYEAGIKIAQEQYALYKGNLRFAGHSLGGGIASAAAIITGGSANTFNAMGVHDNTLRGVDRSNGSITYYYSTFDVARIANALAPASAAGMPVSLGAAGLHGIGGIVKALGGGGP